MHTKKLDGSFDWVTVIIDVSGVTEELGKNGGKKYTSTYEKAHKWIRANISPRNYAILTQSPANEKKFLFKNESDASWFSLVWGK